LEAKHFFAVFIYYKPRMLHMLLYFRADMILSTFFFSAENTT